jgi:hypothetical protein
MRLIQTKDNDPAFKPILKHVNNTFSNVICSGASTMNIHKDSIVLDKYIGKQSAAKEARSVQADTQP